MTLKNIKDGFWINAWTRTSLHWHLNIWDRTCFYAAPIPHKYPSWIHLNLVQSLRTCRCWCRPKDNYMFSHGGTYQDGMRGEKSCQHKLLQCLILQHFPGEMMNNAQQWAHILSNQLSFLQLLLSSKESFVFARLKLAFVLHSSVNTCYLLSENTDTLSLPIISLCSIHTLHHYALIKNPVWTLVYLLITKWRLQ